MPVKNICDGKIIVCCEFVNYILHTLVESSLLTDMLQ